MATKSLDERLEELYNKRDNVGQQFNAADVKTFVEGIRDAREKAGTPIKGATATELQPDETPTAEMTSDGTLVLGIPKGQKGDDGKQGDPGEQGKSAYQVWLEEGNEGTEADFLNSLKAHVSRFIPIATVADATSLDVGDTYAFSDVPNPTDGAMLLMPNGDTTTPKTLMFSVTSNGDTPETFTYTYVGELSISTEGFISSDKIVQNLNTGGADKVLSAEAGMEIGQKLRGITWKETKVEFSNDDLENGYIDRSGSVVAHQTTKSVLVDCSGYRKVRFLGLKTKYSTNNPNYCAFYSDSEGTEVVEVHAIPHNIADEPGSADIILDVPDGAKSFRANCISSTGVITLSNFYLYLGKGEDVKDEIATVGGTNVELPLMDLKGFWTKLYGNLGTNDGDYYISNSTAAVTYEIYVQKLVEEGYTSIKIYPNDTYKAYYAFYKKRAPIESGSTTNLSTLNRTTSNKSTYISNVMGDSSRITIQAGSEPVEISLVGGDLTYLYITVKVTSDVGEVRMPKNIFASGTKKIEGKVDILGNSLEDVLQSAVISGYLEWENKNLSEHNLLGIVNGKYVYYYIDFDEIEIELQLSQASGIITELRFYDQSAQMTSLQYQPGEKISSRFKKGEKYAGQSNPLVRFAISFNKTDNSTITADDVLDAIVTNSIKRRWYRMELSPDSTLHEVETSFGGLKEVVNGSTPIAVQTDEFTSPRESSSFRVVMPNYLRIEWFVGNHGDQLSSTGLTGIKDGDIVDFSAFNTYNQLNRLKFTVLGSNRELTKEYLQSIIDAGELKVFVRNVESDVVKRNYDSEKSVKALESNVGRQYGLRDLPMIVHISDVHSDITRFENAYTYARYLMAHAFVNSGDNCQRGYTNGIDWVADCDAKIQPTPLAADKYVPYINCIGNHDVWKATTQGLFDSMIAPFKDKYGYKSAANTVTDKTYYYYDLAVESPRDQTGSTMAYTNLRFIVLDIVEGMVNYGIGRWHISQTQIEWFISTLNNTPAGYRIMVVLHTPPDTLLRPSKASEAYALHYNKDVFVGADQVEKYEGYNGGTPDGFAGYYLSGNPIVKIIDAFIERGTISDSYTHANDDGTATSAGYTTSTVSYSADFTNASAEFVAYICGHTHRDYICYCQHANNPQLCLCVTCGTAVYGPYENARGASGSDIPRKTIGSTQDAFNVYVLDKQTARVGIARVGSNTNCEGIKREMQWLNYKEVVNFTVNGANCVAVKGQTFSEYINGENIPSTYLYELKRQTGITLIISNGYVKDYSDSKNLKKGNSNVASTYVIQEGDAFTIL